MGKKDFAGEGVRTCPSPCSFLYAANRAHMSSQSQESTSTSEGECQENPRSSRARTYVGARLNYLTI